MTTARARKLDTGHARLHLDVEFVRDAVQRATTDVLLANDRPSPSDVPLIGADVRRWVGYYLGARSRLQSSVRACNRGVPETVRAVLLEMVNQQAGQEIPDVVLDRLTRPSRARTA